MTLTISSFEKTIKALGKLFLLFFSLIPAQKFRTSYGVAIALSFRVMRTFALGGLVCGLAQISHNKYLYIFAITT